MTTTAASVPTTTTNGGGGTAVTTPAPTTTSTTEPAIVTLAVDIEGSVVTGGGRQSVPEGSIVQLVVTADTEDQVVVSGYDLRAVVAPNAAAVFDFAASTTGTFTVELEGTGLVILELEVVP